MRSAARSRDGSSARGAFHVAIQLDADLVDAVVEGTVKGAVGDRRSQVARTSHHETSAPGRRARGFADLGGGAGQLEDQPLSGERQAADRIQEQRSLLDAGERAGRRAGEAERGPGEKGIAQRLLVPQAVEADEGAASDGAVL